VYSLYVDYNRAGVEVVLERVVDEIGDAALQAGGGPTGAPIPAQLAAPRQGICPIANKPYSQRPLLQH